MNKDWGRLARSWQRGPLRSGNGLRIIAHRGFRAAYPENTKSAFFASLGRSHMVELDVRLSLDNAVVIFHDDRLSRCSNAAVIGPKLGLADDRVANWRLSDLRLPIWAAGSGPRACRQALNGCRPWPKCWPGRGAAGCRSMWS